MDMQEVRIKKNGLETELLNIIKKFNKETDCYVSAIKVVNSKPDEFIEIEIQEVIVTLIVQ